MASSGLLIPVAVAAVPAAASLVGAVLSARSARSSREAEADAARLRDLEQRLADRRYDVYRPMIDLLRRMLDQGQPGAPKLDDSKVVPQLSEFSAWISVFGSDDALRAFHNFMQGAYHAAPAGVMMRLYAEFILAARRDMGDGASSVTATELLGLRINDLYEKEGFRQATTLPFEALCAREGWPIPWT